MLKNICIFSIEIDINIIQPEKHNYITCFNDFLIKKLNYFFKFSKFEMVHKLY